MTSQFSFWLYPLLALGVVSLAVRLSLPLSWSWGFIIQALPILACGVLGFFLGPDWLYAIVGWILVLVFYLPPRYFSLGVQKNLTDLNAPAMLELSRRVKLFFWGRAGEFWSDMTKALACYIELKASEADALIEKWQDHKDLPKDIKSLPASYRLIGNGVMWRWQQIIDNYERLEPETSAKMGSSVLLPTARAYAEMSRFSEACQCIKKAKLDEIMSPMAYLALSLLPFFALAGALSMTEKMLSILKQKNKDFPDSNKLYWLGRCHLARGENALARESLEGAIVVSPSERFKGRLESLLQKIDQSEPLDKGSVSEPVDEVWSLFSRAAYVQEIISPQRKSVAVSVLVALICLVYLSYGPIHDLAQWIQPLVGARQWTILLIWVNWFLGTFTLDPVKVLHGEYYRLASYLFLHAHVTHMLLNVVGLIWFGRITENIFGTSRFLAIYLVGGIMSGVAHTLLSPDLPAVGASGAVMAVFGASGAGIYRLKNKIPDSIRRFLLSWLGGLAAFQIVLDQIIPQVAVFAHLGGLLAGLVFGLLLSIRQPASNEQEINGSFVGG
ncbi:MAG: rhomboid family intramembrane serine protease [Candidatus Obscuribacterales bacterium]|nr:rhomboid family intramembrane serine protease [Candidatus Obscuribacterales bacterium]